MDLFSNNVDIVSKLGIKTMEGLEMVTLSL